MKKKFVKILNLLLLLALALGLLVGCNQTTPASAKYDLTANQAAEIIFHDLSYHGVSVGKVDVSNLSFSDKNTAVASVTYTTAEGKSLTQMVPLKKVNGLWEIPDHKH